MGYWCVSKEGIHPLEMAIFTGNRWIHQWFGGTTLTWDSGVRARDETQGTVPRKLHESGGFQTWGEEFSEIGEFQ